MGKTNPPKPTMNEVKNAITNLINQQYSMSQFLSKLDSTLAAYIEYNKNGDSFKKWLKDQMEKANESNNKDSGKSIEGDRETEVRNIDSSGEDKSS